MDIGDLICEDYGIYVRLVASQKDAGFLDMLIYLLHSQLTHAHLTSRGGDTWVCRFYL